jgi:hypothetical protein
MNPMTSSINLLHYASNCLARPTSVTDTAFLLTTPTSTAPHVLSAHMHNLTYKGHQQAHAYPIASAVPCADRYTTGCTSGCGESALETCSLLECSCPVEYI